MSQVKQIQFDPNLFKSGGTRRKRAIKGPTEKVQAAAQAADKARTRRITDQKVNQHLLKEIRQRQQERNRQMVQSATAISNPPVRNDAKRNDTKREGAFEESMQYLAKVAAHGVQKPKVVFNPKIMASTNPSPTNSSSVQPPYSCLKGSVRPNFKEWQLMQRNAPAVRAPTHTYDLKHQRAKEINDTLDLLDDDEDESESGDEDQGTEPVVPKAYQRRRHVRTYRVGMSKVKPQVAVLLSNKTRRQSVSDRLTQLKKEPMRKVKQELIRNGFIKLGSTAPDNVLRTMHEAIHMIGDVKNYSPDIVIHNLMHRDEPS